MTEQRGVALVRRPSPRLAEGIVTYIERTPVDLARAQQQHQSYVDTLSEHGWAVREVPAADDCPDSVFIEDTLIVCEDLAIVTRPGAPERRPETAAVLETARDLGLRVVTINAPATLDGGDVLQVGRTVYVGHSTRTNLAGIDALTACLAPLGRSVVTIPLATALHLKSAATALPDGTVLTFGSHIAVDTFPQVLRAPEESGAHVVPIGGPAVLLAASAPQTASMLASLGWTPVPVDVSEFERLEGCVTCLSVLIPGR
jgi:dimethylargininase